LDADHPLRWPTFARRSTIVAYLVAGRAVFLHGFAKSDRDNIEQALEEGKLMEIEYDDDQKA
jgi:hypothetical protein